MKFYIVDVVQFILIVSRIKKNYHVRVCVSSTLGRGEDDEKTVEYGQLDEAPDADLGPAAILGSSVGGGRRHGGVTSGGGSGVQRVLDWMRAGCGIGDRLPCSRCTTRFQVALLSSIGFCISFGIRCNMGLAVLQMTSNQTRWTLAPYVKTMHPNLTHEMVGERLFLCRYSSVFCLPFRFPV